MQIYEFFIVTCVMSYSNNSNAGELDVKLDENLTLIFGKRRTN